jgi:hypothetical protein
MDEATAALPQFEILASAFDAVSGQAVIWLVAVGKDIPDFEAGHFDDHHEVLQQMIEYADAVIRLSPEQLCFATDAIVETHGTMHQWQHDIAQRAKLN